MITAYQAKATQEDSVALYLEFIENEIKRAASQAKSEVTIKFESEISYDELNTIKSILRKNKFTAICSYIQDKTLEISW